MKYSFERPFRLKILALMLDNVWFTEYGNVLIRPEYFDMEDEEATAKAILEYHKVYGHCPDDPNDVTALSNAAYNDLVCQIFDIAEEGSLQLAKDKALEFAKEQAIKLALLESVNNINGGDYQDIIKRFQDAMKVGDIVKSSGLDPVRDTEKWLYAYWTDKVRTGMYHVDETLDGGLSAGEFGVIIGPPGRGKSMALINTGYGAASIGSGKNVVHFTHEMKVEQVCKRYAARMVFRFPQRDGDLTVYEDDLIRTARRFVPGQIRVIGGSKMTFEEVHMHLDRLTDTGYEIGLIIDDYPDLMTPAQRYGEKRYELSSIYEDWRNIAGEYGCPVWGATQSTRGSLSKEIITMADVAEDIGKAAIADVMIALCQTYEEKQSDQARLFMAKIRDADNKHPLISCKWYGDSQAIVTTGFIKPKSKDREQDA